MKNLFTIFALAAPMLAFAQSGKVLEVEYSDWKGPAWDSQIEVSLDAALDSKATYVFECDIKYEGDKVEPKFNIVTDNGKAWAAEDNPQCQTDHGPMVATNEWSHQTVEFVVEEGVRTHEGWTTADVKEQVKVLFYFGGIDNVEFNGGAGKVSIDNIKVSKKGGDVIVYADFDNGELAPFARPVWHNDTNNGVFSFADAPAAPKDGPKGEYLKVVLEKDLSSSPWDSQIEITLDETLDSKATYVFECDIKYEGESENPTFSVVTDNGKPWTAENNEQCQTDHGPMTATSEWSHQVVEFVIEDGVRAAEGWTVNDVKEQVKVLFYFGANMGTTYVDNIKLSVKDGDEIFFAGFDGGKLDPFSRPAWHNDANNGVYSFEGSSAIIFKKAVVKDGIERTLSGAVAPEGYKGIVIKDGAKYMKK